MATIIPSEIFIKICSYLSPSDLYSLTTVCKNYRSMLWSFTSTTTQSIWCNSREQFISHLTLPPPKDMSEQQYIWLMVLLNKCQFCKENDKKKLSMCWEFRMYCCQRCLAQRTVSRDTLLKEWELPDILITCFTSLPPNAQRPQLFLISEEDINNNEKLLLWIKSNQEEIALLKSQNKRYIFQHDEGRYDHNEQLDRLFNTLNMSIEYNIKINDSRRNSRSLMDDDIDELLS
ncbi:7964_t:CDS:2 [Entrophospora sp. SA101]|nr:7964_t:CDS:2 [Entrophospora sp. SA101]